jgi:hypothetical protein
VAKIGGLAQVAFNVDENRQIAADPHGIHVVKEESTVAAEEVLHIVFGRRDKHVEAGLFHQAIEPAGIKRHVRAEIRRLGCCEHIHCSLGALWRNGMS